MESHRVNSIISGRSPPLHCTLTLITMRDTEIEEDYFSPITGGCSEGLGVV